jgi:hypothetical protein
MSGSRNRFSEEFVRYFSEIKRQLGGSFDKASFINKLHADSNFAVLAGRLVEMKYSFEKELKRKTDKTLKQMHPDFGPEFKKFAKHWAELVDRI